MLTAAIERVELSASAGAALLWSASNLTIPEKILVAVFDKWPDKGQIFTEADITVVAWKKFPETFGLRGYANEYPDSKHILSNIMGQKGLRGKRWISQLGDTRYTLTQSGLDYAADLVAADYGGYERFKKSVGDYHLRILRRLFGGMAYSFWCQQKEDELIFRDACDFWNITPGSTGEELEERLTNIETVFSLVRELLKDGRSLEVTNNRSITAEELNECNALNSHLQDMFQDDLSYIKRREKKRGIKRVRS